MLIKRNEHVPEAKRIKEQNTETDSDLGKAWYQHDLVL